MYDLIVLGAGPGGYEAAAYAGHLGKKVAIIEKRSLGGICLNAGCIPTKTLLCSAKLLRELKTAEIFGIKTSLLSIDYPLMHKRKREIVATLAKGVLAKLKHNHVEIIIGNGMISTPHSVIVGEQILEAEHILIATGSSPVIPPINGIEALHVMDAGQILEWEHVPDNLVIIGAGAIGLEFASFFAALGTNVQVIEKLPRIGGQIDKEMAGYLLKQLEKQGILFHLSASVVQIEQQAVTYQDADGKTCIAPCEVVLNATGRKPNIDNIGLESLGVELNATGINTDAGGSTSLPGIWACGDVTGRCLQAHAATREGIVAVNNMFGKPDTMRYHGIPSVIYTFPELAGVGMTEQRLQEIGMDYQKSVVPLSVSGRFIAEYGKKQGYVKVLTGTLNNQVLGIHILGGPASEMIFGATHIVETGMTLNALETLVFAHPTVSEAIKEAFHQIAAKPKDIIS